MAAVIVLSTSLLCAPAALPAEHGPTVVVDYGRFGTELKGEAKLNALEMVALQTEGNFQRMRTCNGTYEFVDRIHFPFPVPVSPEEMENTVPPTDPVLLKDADLLKRGGPKEGRWSIHYQLLHFRWDIQAEKYHAWYDTDGKVCYIDAVAGTEYELTREILRNHWTSTPEYLLEFESQATFGQLEGFPPVEGLPSPGTHVIYRKPQRRSGRSPVRVEDVRDFFATGHRRPGERCRLVISWLRGEASEEFQRIAEERYLIFTDGGSPPAITVIMNSGPGHQSITQYDGNAGFNLVRYSSVSKRRSKEVKGDLSVRYDVRSGIYFPVEVERAHYEGEESAALTKYQSFRLKEVTFGEEIPDSEFTPQAFGLKYGDRLADEIKGELFVYDPKAGFVPAEHFRFDPSRLAQARPPAPPKGGPGLGTWLIIFNLVCLLAAGTYLIWKRKSARE